MKRNKLTFGIPLYNCEKSIKKLLSVFDNKVLESISYEVFVVDDGSTDKGYEVCKSFNNSNIKVITKDNEGVSSTRNYIINNCSGDWLTFIDSDDMIDIEEYVKVYNKLENSNYDFFINVFNKKNYKSIINSKNPLNYLLKEEIINPPWTKFYKVAELRKNHILFDKKISLGEDLKFNLDYYLISKKIGFYYSDLYYYDNSNIGSLSNKYRDNKFYIIKQTYDYFDNKLKDQSTRSIFEYKRVKGKLSCVRDEILFSNKNKQQIINYINDLKSERHFKFVWINYFSCLAIYYMWYLCPSSLLYYFVDIFLKRRFLKRINKNRVNKSKRIYYVAHYIPKKFNEERMYGVSSLPKISYIIDHIPCEYTINVLSPSRSISNHSYKHCTYRVSDRITVDYPMSFSARNFFTKKFSYVISQLWLLIKLLRVNRNDTVLLYHDTFNMTSVNIAKTIRKFFLIIEVEEIFADVRNSSQRKRNKEIKFLNNANMYILVSSKLCSSIDVRNKRYCILNGTYAIPQSTNQSIKKNKIVIVYSGIINNDKGAFECIELAKKLDAKYEIRIIGYGKKIDIDKLKQAIELNNRTNNCMVYFDGLKQNEEYQKYLQSCDIGLSTQNPNAAFNTTSFPSKIISYMANGLRVVSIRLSAIESSDIGKYVYYYDEQTPEKIAQAIMSIDMNDDYDSKKIIKKLDEKFQKELEEILDE